MFKFAKYFFIVFLVTAVIPLLLMFFWNHRQMEHMRIEKEQRFIEVGIKQLEHNSNQYLKLKESTIISQIHDISGETVPLSRLKKILKINDVQWIYGEKINKISSHYKVIHSKSSDKPELCVIMVIPYDKSGIKGIKTVEKIDFAQLRPDGPFDLEVYEGDGINKNNLIHNIRDPFAPNSPPSFMHHPPDHSFSGMPPGRPPHEMHDFPPPEMNEPPHPWMLEPPPHKIHEFPSVKNGFNKTLKVKDENGRVIATLLLRLLSPDPPFGHGANPLERDFGLIVLFAGSILSLLTGFYINRNFINPLLALSDASKRVQKGDLSFELNTGIRQEQIQNTFNNFNQMIKGLKEKDELRKSFIANLTHDLKTPLIAQERCLELISNEFSELGKEEAYQLAKSVEKNNNHLLRMVNLILESYRFDSASLNITTSGINLYELINNCHESLNELLKDKNVQFLNNIPEDFPQINGDMTGLKRVFLNLISNSIESITHNGFININAEVHGNFVEISVEDNGSGISKEDMTHIFDRYFTGKSDERKLGSGLGLYVCKKLIEMHNGEIAVKSEQNKYTRFTIKLPLNSTVHEDKK